MRLQFLLTLSATLALVAAAPTLGPTIKLDSGTFVGASSGLTDAYLGINFAKPPVGDLRFRLPQPIPPYKGTHIVTRFGPMCPQQAMDFPFAFPGRLGEYVKYILNLIYALTHPDILESEDCLNINVIKPATASETSKLPVLAWIYGGGFEGGDPNSSISGTNLVTRSMELGSPVVYVSLNYRVNGFGFLASKEVKEAGVGNLGLHDQREALRWIKKYIAQFGGDPNKVTIWGGSAGAVSASLQMLTNGGNTEGLFRAAFMESGAPLPVGDITHGQEYYDFIVAQTGCSEAVNTLECLRKVPYASIKDAINRTPSIFSFKALNLAWVPRTDGVFLKENPQILVQKNIVANIPYVTSNCDDEGTMFSFSTNNLTQVCNTFHPVLLTEAETEHWVKSNFFPKMTDKQIKQFREMYPSDVTKGSPFDTGTENAFTPQFKRIAAFQGDGVFQAPRRWLLQNTVPTNPHVWSFLSKRGKSRKYLGASHGSDFASVESGDLGDYLIRFATTLNPNPSGPHSFHWPNYDLKTRQLMLLQDDPPRSLITDTYRQAPMEFLTKLCLEYPI
ncbi:carotenoid ester lipase precursor [Agrocybe pediades]|nr:carotenoid ester lipase precursor [Agrocybe pediades]